ncbi:MAG: hypothetical protein CL820_05710 [Croceicoccus sp.]|nr:hypothetical protein [Croceicoccus sp.]MAL25385.1 hypothetical protein [Croceicoccus sp.]
MPSFQVLLFMKALFNGPFRHRLIAAPTGGRRQLCIFPMTGNTAHIALRVPLCKNNRNLRWCGRGDQSVDRARLLLAMG